MATGSVISPPTPGTSGVLLPLPGLSGARLRFVAGYGVLKPTYFATPAAFQAWLRVHHAEQAELLVGFYKRGSGRPSITWPESVDEALCFGWIDGVRRSIDAEAYSIRFTPRRPTSIWSAINVARVAELQRQGRMHPAGERAFAARTPERTGVYSFERHQAAKLSRAEGIRF